MSISTPAASTQSKAAKAAEALAAYQQMPGWPAKPTLSLAERQQRPEILKLQSRYERALEEKRAANGAGND